MTYISYELPLPNGGWEDTQADDRDEQIQAGWNDSDDIDEQDLEKDA